MRNQIDTQRQNLEVEAQAHAVMCGVLGCFKLISCNNSQQPNALSYALDKTLEQEAKDFGSSVLALTIHDAIYY
jgi:hypothetical protein